MPTGLRDSLAGYSQRQMISYMFQFASSNCNHGCAFPRTWIYSSNLAVHIIVTVGETGYAYSLEYCDLECQKETR